MTFSFHTAARAELNEAIDYYDELAEVMRVTIEAPGQVRKQSTNFTN